MIRVNENYSKLASNYLFSDIAKRVAKFQEQNPEAKIIRLGIGDVTLPLTPTCVEAFHKGVKDMASDATFRGYGPEQGYDFLRKAIAENDYKSIGADISPEEVFVSDGAKCDTGNIQELFSNDIKIAVPDPVYPVYVDTNVMAGRTGNFENGRYDGLVYLESNSSNNYIPDVPSQPVDLIYLCFPNNPTGACATKEQLAKWVAYAKENRALILYDAAYEAYIRDTSLPRSIYQIEGARDVAIEFRSLSKTAGFTGTRCAFTVVPKTCMAWDNSGKSHNLHSMWNRRHTTKFNGVSYPVQRAAEAIYSDTGKKEVREMTDYYLGNARLIRETIQKLGYHCVGGDNSPYIWFKTEKDSWDFFDMLLNKAAVVCTPGSGFGFCGKGYVRISAFNHREKVIEGLDRIAKLLK
jgi:LL-diaminopimelate aminotransferase